MSKINPPDSTYDVVSEEIMKRPYIHSCGNSVDAESLKAWFQMCDQKQQPRTCLRCNVVVIGMSDFTLNRDLQSAIEALPQLGTSQILTPPAKNPQPVQATHINLSLNCFGKAARSYIDQHNHWLYKTHINKKGTDKVAVDSTRNFAVIHKDGKWRIYPIKGQSGAVKESKDQNDALTNIRL